MNSKVATSNIEELSILNKRGITPKYVEDNGIVVINQKCIRDQVVSLEQSRLTSRDKKIAEEKKLQDFDVLVNSTGVGTLGRVAQVMELKEPMTVDSHVTILRPNQVLVDPIYFGYLIKNKQKNIEALAEGSTGQTELSRVLLGQIELTYHTELDDQKKIAHILSTLDEKIELNRQMNQTLEAMAQALFKSWFVDFDPVYAKAEAKSDAELEMKAAELGIAKEVLELFPSRFVESEMGLIPVGWEVKPLSKVATLSTKSVKPHAEPEKLWTHYSIPAFDESNYPIQEFGQEIKSNKYVVDKSAILSSKLNPRTERTWLPNVVDESASICSTEFMQFVPVQPEQRSYVYYLIKSDDFQHEIKSRVTGTTGSRQRAQPKQVAVVDVVSASDEIIKAFCNITSNTTSKLLTNLEEIQTLQKTRDTLLPKLLSGELDVSRVVDT